MELFSTCWAIQTYLIINQTYRGLTVCPFKNRLGCGRHFCLMYEQKLFPVIILMLYYLQSGLPGFYDPCIGEEKSLYIRYKFRNRLHQATVGDMEPIRLPQQSMYVSLELVFSFLCCSFCSCVLSSMPSEEMHNLSGFYYFSLCKSLVILTDCCSLLRFKSCWNLCIFGLQGI